LGIVRGVCLLRAATPKQEAQQPALGHYALLCLALQQMLKVDQSINQSLQLETVHVHMQTTSQYKASTAAFYSVSYTPNSSRLLLPLQCKPAGHASISCLKGGGPRIQVAQNPANHNRQCPAASPCINTCSPSVGEQTCLHSLSV
jgi:hypothetical protein